MACGWWSQPTAADVENTLKKTRLIAHTYTQRHRSKKKKEEKTYTKAVITHTHYTHHLAIARPTLSDFYISMTQVHVTEHLSMQILV